MDLAYDDVGSGPVVLLVHAGIADRRMWRHQVPALSERHRVIAVDERCHGDSPWAAERTPHADLLGLMDHLGIDQAAAVGCSNGGRTIVDAALAAPSRFDRLALIAAGLSGFAMRPSWLELWQDRVYGSLGPERLAAYRGGADLTDAEAERIAVLQTRMLVAGPDRDETALAPDVWELAVDMALREIRTPESDEVLLEPPAVGRLHELTMPVLVLSGDADVPEILDMSRAYATGIPGARHVRIPATGHLPPLERPDEVNAALLAFLGDAES
ncbi:alpha/beta fold hydrolase [Labedaea rhizosphaerae]|uniref:Pimeloyl-ACP methyl ester carboxylesterase n=1 Tax=Labedaea rhizosphaerae TaxID=598644 RepID=A0A4R6S5A2_LABRH|nr:alpha/beta fold hydrolase [Labedaea rhizosphaerae]TDP94890.1 pimeloyl-ACP methyl ester carboxylesterase [Labedaea rhizosphaerae]